MIVLDACTFVRFECGCGQYIRTASSLELVAACVMNVEDHRGEHDCFDLPIRLWTGTMVGVWPGKVWDMTTVHLVGEFSTFYHLDKALPSLGVLNDFPF